MSNESLERAIQDRSSRLPGFYRLPLARRRAAVARWADLSVEELDLWERGLDSSRADALIENVVGTYALPVGVATNFLVNGREVLVPMAVEEPSVVAAASHGALMARRGGGFEAKADAPVMIGQVQVIDLPGDDLDAACARIEAQREAILATAHAQSRSLPALGGGALGMELRRFPETSAGPMLVLHLYYDTRDAMGANAVNTACEAIAGIVESASGGTVLMRILSNLADRRLVRAACRVPAQALARDGIDGAEVARRIVAANALAEVDPYRAATHNKGILNGIDPVIIATGNDWRGVEAGAHAFAARSGSYRSLTEWKVDAETGDLLGSLELPMAIGIVGGGTRSLPLAGLGLKILGVGSAGELAEIVASVGLAQNLSALRALVCEGIQDGHMALHARQLALAAGASAESAARIAEQLVAEGQIRGARALELVMAGAAD
ncbi:MAG: hydroxymethylglutaryl-CoA reductase, degradative [Caldilineae bacterium]|nr:hydroxymethylglutaryl-CoA reductase, degradative [Caldilineae bacterium]